MCVCMYIYIYICKYVHVCMYMCIMCVCLFVYIYIYIYRLIYRCFITLFPTNIFDCNFESYSSCEFISCVLKSE